MKLQLLYLFAALLFISIYSCKNKSPKINLTLSFNTTYKGLYSFSAEERSFKECKTGREFWAADSSAQLELQYSQLNNKRDEPVYVEVEGKKVKTVADGMGSGYDSTLVVTKLIKITKDIPKNGCN